MAFYAPGGSLLARGYVACVGGLAFVRDHPRPHLDRRERIRHRREQSFRSRTRPTLEVGISLAIATVPEGLGFSVIPVGVVEPQRQAPGRRPDRDFRDATTSVCNPCTLRGEILLEERPQGPCPSRPSHIALLSPVRDNVPAGARAQ